MATIIGGLCRQAFRNPDKLNILCMPTHERFESNLSCTGHNFYAWHGPGIKTWNNLYADVPSNYHLLNPQLHNKQIPLELNFDLILSQNKFSQFQVAQQLSHELHLPLVSLEHTLPPIGRQDLILRSQQMRGNINVFISEYSIDQWQWDKENATVVHHGIDTEYFHPDQSVARQPRVLSVVNDFINRDYWCGYTLWQQITQEMPTWVIGDTPGLSKAAASTDELIQAYQTSRIFLNTSLVSPIPMSLLESMACGCTPVSTATCMIPEIIENGVNGFISNDARELKKYVQLLLDDEPLSRRLGEAARQTIVDKFSLQKFVDNWNQIFKNASNIVYTGAIRQ